MPTYQKMVIFISEIINNSQIYQKLMKNIYKELNYECKYILFILNNQIEKIKYKFYIIK